jgi:8-oxo-dGTP pyrophosphatase MutT (NUDIX family)
MKPAQDVEILDIVDQNNTVIGSAPKDDIYDKKLLHRIVHVLVLHPKIPAIYLQKRSATKSFLPNYYCTSAGGHVRSGETHNIAAIRELKEEIGITNPIKEVDDFIFTGENGHQRLIKVFITTASGGFSFTDGEVSEGEFFSLSDTKKMIDKNEKIHPQLKACFDRLFDSNFFDFYN